MEVFISEIRYTGVIHPRNKFSEAAGSQWCSINGTRLEEQAGVTIAGRFIESERLACELCYCIADDDCLPCPSLDFNDIVRLFVLNPDYATIGMMNLLAPVKGEGLVESHAVGGIRFIRKGVVTEFPADFNGDDSAYYDLVRAKGFKQGIITTYPFLHLGLWHSTWRKP